VDRGRNTCLEDFESRGVRTIILFYHDKPLPVPGRCNQYLMLRLSESLDEQDSGGSRGVADSGDRDAACTRNSFHRRDDWNDNDVLFAVIETKECQAPSSSEMTTTCA